MTDQDPHRFTDQEASEGRRGAAELRARRRSTSRDPEGGADADRDTAEARLASNEIVASGSEAGIESESEGQRSPKQGVPSPRATPSLPSPDAVAQLWADQFRHLTTLGVAGAGGVLVLVQAQLMARGWEAALILFLLAASVAMFGQVNVTEEASAGRLPGKSARALLKLSLLFLGAGTGYTVMILA